MTKDGRPSRINDIRYFYPDKHSYLTDYEDEVAFGRRLAFFLNGEGYSLGSYPSLYLLFTPSVEAGAIRVTDDGGDWWQRYTHVGVPGSFPNVPDAGVLIKQGTVAALNSIRPDLKQTVKRSADIVETSGGELRFLLKSREMKRFAIDISFTVAVWPQPSYLFASLTELSTGQYLEAPKVELSFYVEAFDLAGSVRVIDNNMTVRPNQSIRAQLASARHGGPLVMATSDFSPATRPVLSKLISRRS